MLMHGWLGVERAPWIRDFWMLDVKEKLWVSFAFSDHFPSARYAFSMSLVDFRQVRPPLKKGGPGSLFEGGISLRTKTCPRSAPEEAPRTAART